MPWVGPIWWIFPPDYQYMYYSQRSSYIYFLHLQAGDQKFEFPDIFKEKPSPEEKQLKTLKKYQKESIKNNQKYWDKQDVAQWFRWYKASGSDICAHLTASSLAVNWQVSSHPGPLEFEQQVVLLKHSGRRDGDILDTATCAWLRWWDVVGVFSNQYKAMNKLSTPVNLVFKMSVRKQPLR